MPKDAARRGSAAGEMHFMLGFDSGAHLTCVIGVCSGGVVGKAESLD